jgi:hypothetical protein
MAVFGQWELVEGAPVLQVPMKKILCKCSCGVERYVFMRSLTLGQSKSCGHTKHNKGKSKYRPYETVYRRFLTVAHGSGKDVNLSFEEFLQFVQDKNCHYCGDEVVWNAFTLNRKSNPYNLDRKDNSLGYSKENCVVCCRSCNYGKGDRFTYEEWVIMTDALRRFRHGNNIYTYAAVA